VYKPRWLNLSIQEAHAFVAGRLSDTLWSTSVGCVIAIRKAAGKKVLVILTSTWPFCSDLYKTAAGRPAPFRGRDESGDNTRASSKSSDALHRYYILVEVDNGPNGGVPMERTVKFPLRLTPDLHELLRRAAFARCKSMHQYVIDVLRREAERDAQAVQVQTLPEYRAEKEA